MQLNNADDLDATLQALAEQPGRRDELGERSYQTWQENRGSTKRVAAAFDVLYLQRTNNWIRTPPAVV